MDWIEPLSARAVQDFVFENEQADPRKLVLQHKTLAGLPAPMVAQQLAGRRKAKAKLPQWYATRGIVYPPTLNLEQSSSQATALFKAAFLKHASSQQVLADLTGGFGADSFFFSQQFETVTYVEPDANLLAIARHNHQRLGMHTINYVHATAEAYLAASPAAVFYLDPARRDALARKVVKLADCTPDCTQLQSQILKNSEWLLVKASPLLDIQQGLRELPNTKTVLALSVENEMKELLLLVQRGHSAATQIRAIDLHANGEVNWEFAFTHTEEATAILHYSEPLAYLYEPGAAMLKAGAFKRTAQHFQLEKLAPNTHLYTSHHLISDFPGRTFRIEHLNPTEEHLKELLPERRAHVAVRNYPLTAQQLMKKLRLQEGGNSFVWGFSGTRKKYLALCQRLR